MRTVGNDGSAAIQNKTTTVKIKHEYLNIIDLEVVNSADVLMKSSRIKLFAVSSSRPGESLVKNSTPVCSAKGTEHSKECSCLNSCIK